MFQNRVIFRLRWYSWAIYLFMGVRSFELVTNILLLGVLEMEDLQTRSSNFLAEFIPSGRQQGYDPIWCIYALLSQLFPGFQQLSLRQTVWTFLERFQVTLTQVQSLMIPWYQQFSWAHAHNNSDHTSQLEGFRNLLRRHNYYDDENHYFHGGGAEVSWLMRSLNRAVQDRTLDGWRRCVVSVYLYLGV